MGVGVRGVECRRNARAAGFGYGKAGLYRNGSLDIEGAGVEERRTDGRESDEIPVEPGPVEAERIGNQDGRGVGNQIGDPVSGFCHGGGGVGAFPDESVTIESVDVKGVG